MIYFPYHTKSHFSILEAFATPKRLIRKAAELNLPAIALTDSNSISGVVEFINEAKKIENGPTPIIGADIYLDIGGYVTILCKNLQGWHNLIKILGHSYLSEDTRSIVHSLNTIEQYCNGLICIVGGTDNDFWNLLQSEQTKQNIITLSKIFNDDLYISLENNNTEEDRVVNQYVTNLLSSSQYKIIQTNTVHYISPEDSLLQKIQLCSAYDLTLKNINQLLIRNRRKFSRFIEANECYVKQGQPSPYLTEILNKIETFSIAKMPQLPDYLDNNGNIETNPYETILTLCRKGWINRDINKKTYDNPELKDAYTRQIKEELETFKEMNVAAYMLIIWDIINFCRQHNINVGLRGSAAGCLISYLIGISEIDPLLPDPTLSYHPDRCLQFSRFLNRGRYSEGHISPPDIDIDIPRAFRERVIEYVINKYGQDRVAHIITFSRMDGRAVLKEVFKILEPCPNAFEVANLITSHMYDKAKIQDELEDIRADNPDYSTLEWNIDNHEIVREYYNEYKYEFDLAIQLSNTIKAQGRHAAGIVVCNQPLKDTFPTIIDTKHGDRIISMEMAEAEYIGAVKYDFLSVAAYEKIDKIIEMVNNGYNEPVMEYITNTETEAI